MIQSLLIITLFFLLVLVSWIDVRTQRIPDCITLSVAVVGLSQTVLTGGDQQAMLNSFLGMLLFGGTFMIVRAAYFFARNVEGLGMGDVKLAAAAGIWVEPFQLPAFLILSSAVTLIVSIGVSCANHGQIVPRPGMRIPFGPGLALALFLTVTLDPMAK